MRRSRIAGLILGLGLLLPAFALDESKPGDPDTRVRVGEAVPPFSLVTLEGEKIDIQAMKGKVILINFFADWCPPCKKEMPRLEKDIWRKYKGKNFLLLGIGRENTREEVAQFRKDFSVTFPLGPDPQREIYAKFARQYIPRNILVDKNGWIVYQSRGYEEEEFAGMIALIDQTLRESAKTEEP